MTRREFHAALARYLDGDELQRTLEFYDEIIDDRMEEGMSEADAVAALGSIEQIVAEMHTVRPAKPRRNVWKIIAICCIPLWVPIAISLLAVLLALYIVIWVLILCIGIVVLACAIVAAAGLLTLPFAIMESVTYFVMVMGCTLLGGGIALLLIPAFWFAARGTARLTGYCLRRIFVR